MIVRTFMPRFHEQVRYGVKKQTVRPRPKRMPKVGDVFDGRAWTGKPYRSPQKSLIVSEITRISTIKIFGCWRWTTPLEIILDGQWLSSVDIERFAFLDGFKDAADMEQHFRMMGELPLEDGIVIYWK